MRKIILLGILLLSLDIYGNQLINSVSEGDIDTVQELLSKKVNVNAQDKEGKTALMIASMEGFHDIVDLLLDRKANVNIKD